MTNAAHRAQKQPPLPPQCAPRQLLRGASCYAAGCGHTHKHPQSTHTRTQTHMCSRLFSGKHHPARCSARRAPSNRNQGNVYISCVWSTSSHLDEAGCHDGRRVRQAPDNASSTTHSHQFQDQHRVMRTSRRYSHQFQGQHREMHT